MSYTTFLDAERHLAATLTKRQLAEHLNRSERWVELRVRDGMPSLPPSRRYACRRFILHEVEAWLADGRPTVESVPEQIHRLETELGRLRERVQQLEEGRAA